MNIEYEGLFSKQDPPNLLGKNAQIGLFRYSIYFTRPKPIELYLDLSVKKK